MKELNMNKQSALFNFKWQRHHILRLHQIAKSRGISASAIIKNLLLKEFEADKLNGVHPS